MDFVTNRQSDAAGIPDAHANGIPDSHGNGTLFSNAHSDAISDGGSYLNTGGIADVYSDGNSVPVANPHVDAHPYCHAVCFADCYANATPQRDRCEGDREPR